MSMLDRFRRPKGAAMSPIFLPSAETLRANVYGREKLTALINEFVGHPDELLERLTDAYDDKGANTLEKLSKDGSNREAILAAIDIFGEDPEKIYKLMTSPGLHGEGYALDTCMSYVSDPTDILVKTVEYLKPRPDLLGKLFAFKRHEDTNILNRGYNFGEDKLKPGAYAYLRAMRDRPDLVRDALLNFSDAHEERAVDSRIFWSEEGIALIRDIFRDEPETLKEIVSGTNRLFGCARGHAAVATKRLFDAYKDFPDALKALVVRRAEKDRNIPEEYVGLTALEMALRSIGGDRDTSTLSAFISATQGYLAFPAEHSNKLLLGERALAQKSAAELRQDELVLAIDKFLDATQGYEASFPVALARKLREEILSNQANPVGKKVQAIAAALKLDGKAIKHIPKQGTEQHTAYLIVMEKLNTLASAVDSAHLTPKDDGSLYVSPIIASIVSQSPGDWKALQQELAEYSVSRMGDFADTFKEFTTYTALPVIAELIGADAASKLSIEQVSELARKATEVTAQKLCKGKSLKNIVGMSETWHARRSAILSEIRDYAFEGSWHALIENKHLEVDSGIAKGWQIVNLTSAADLDAEGSKLHHCVSGYSGVCLASDDSHSDILSVRDENGNIDSTIELKHTKKGEGDIQPPHSGYGLSVKQHRGAYNHEASEKSKATLAWLKENLEGGKIKLGWHVGKDEKADKGLRPPFINAIGFEPSPNNLDRAWKAFSKRDDNALRITRNRSFVPDEYRELTVHQFLHQTGVVEALANTLVGMGFTVKQTPKTLVTRALSVPPKAPQAETAALQVISGVVADTGYTAADTIHGQDVVISALKLKDGFCSAASPAALEKADIHNAQYFGAVLPTSGAGLPTMWGFDLSANRQTAIAEAEAIYRGFVIQTARVDSASATKGLAITGFLYSKVGDFERVYSERVGQAQPHLNKGNARLFEELAYGFNAVSRITAEQGVEAGNAFWESFRDKLVKGIAIPNHQLILANGALAAGEERRLLGDGRGQ